MDLSEARRFLERHHRAVLATYGPGGSVQMSPVLATTDGEGRVVVSTGETAYKTRNLRRDPRAVLCVVTERFFGEWLLVEGTAKVLSLPESMEPLVDYYRAIRGEHHDWDEYREAMRREGRVLLRIHIDVAGPTHQG